MNFLPSDKGSTPFANVDCKKKVRFPQTIHAAVVSHPSICWMQRFTDNKETGETNFRVYKFLLRLCNTILLKLGTVCRWFESNRPGNRDVAQPVEQQ